MFCLYVGRSRLGPAKMAELMDMVIGADSYGLQEPCVG